MLTASPRLYPAVACAVLTVMLYALFKATPPGEWEQNITGAIMVVTAGVMFVTGGNWALYEFTQRLAAFRHAMTITPEARVLELERQNLEAFARLTQAHLEAARDGTIRISCLPGSPYPVWSVTILGVDIPRKWIGAWIDAGQWPWLLPRRAYGEGTRDHDWSDLLTEYVAGMGWAEPAQGNKPARWLVAREQARQYLGVEEAEE